MADKRDILVRLLGEETVAKMADRAGKGLDRFGDSLEATEKDAKGLDRQIEEVEDSLRALAVAYARTQDAADRLDLTKAMRKQEAELRRLTKARKLVPDVEPDPEGFVAKFAARVGPLLAKVPLPGGPMGAALGAAAAVAVVPALGAAAAGAIVGGVGIGGVIGGLKLAAQDSRVRAAGAELGDAVTSDLDKLGSAFVRPALAGIGEIRDAWDDVQDDAQETAAAASRYVVPLAKGVGDAVRAITPGIRAATQAAGPIVRELSSGLPRLGRAVGDVLTELADDSDAGASALRGLIIGADGTIRAVGGVISTLADLYRGLVLIEQKGLGFAEKVWGWLPVIGDQIKGGKKDIDEMAAALEGSGDEGSDAGIAIFDGLMKAADAAGAAGVEVEGLNQKIRRLADQNVDAVEANIALEEAMDRAAEAAKRNNDGIDAGNEKGRANLDLLVALRDAAMQNVDAIFAQTGSQEAANKEAERARAAFIAAAVGMGASRAEAKRLADQLFAIPEVTHVKVVAETKDASGKLTGFIKQVNSLDGRVITVRTRLDRDGEHISGSGKQLKFSAGGPVMGPGAKGVDSVPAVLAPGEHVLTASEVDAAGGHAGVERIRAALRGEASAPVLAGTGAPAGGGGGGGHRTYHITVNVPPTANPVEAGRATVEAIRAYEQRNGTGWRT